MVFYVASHAGIMLFLRFCYAGISNGHKENFLHSYLNKDGWKLQTSCGIL